MNEKDIWNEISIEDLKDFENDLKTLRQKIHFIYEHEKTSSNDFLKYTVLQHHDVHFAVKQICISRFVAHKDPNESGPPSITIVCLTRYLIELYGYLRFFEENPEDGMNEWFRYNDLNIADWSKSIKDLGVLRKEFSDIHEALQTMKNDVQREMSVLGLNIKNMKSVKSLLENTVFAGDATYYHCYQYLSKYTHPTLVGICSRYSQSTDVLNICVGLTNKLVDEFNQLYTNIIDKYGISSTPRN